MTSRLSIHRINLRLYERYLTRDGVDKIVCRVCNLELNPYEGVVAKTHGGPSHRHKIMYCPLCACEKNIVFLSDLERELGPPNTWFYSVRIIERFNERLENIRAMEKKDNL